MPLIQRPVAVVGAGMTGAVISRMLAEQGLEVDVYERREHVGGNCHDYYELNSYTHCYGPHLFHTSDLRVVNFLRQFTEFRPYFHKVTAFIDGAPLPIPFSLQTLQLTHPRYLAARLSEKLVDSFGFGNATSIYALLNSPDSDLKQLGDYIYRSIFLGYSQKQWGIDDPLLLDKGVLNRIPVRINHDTNYFVDRFQMLPARGYTELFEKMLSHPNINLHLNQSAELLAQAIDPSREDINIGSSRYSHVFYCGMIDQFCNFEFGRLSYRSLQFESKTVSSSHRDRPTFITNYPMHFEFTRIADYSHLSPVLGLSLHDQSRIIVEYPGEYDPGSQSFSEAYYPLFTNDARALYRRYEDHVEPYRALVTICGRLGHYKYYDMDDACVAAMSIATRFLSSIA